MATIVNYFRLNGNYFFLVLEDTKLDFTYYTASRCDDLIQDIKDGDSEWNLAPQWLRTDCLFKGWISLRYPTATINKVRIWRQAPRNKESQPAPRIKRSKPNIIIPHKTTEFCRVLNPTLDN